MVAPAPNRLQSKIPIRSCSHQKVIEGELVELAVLLFRPLPPQPSSIMRCVQSWRSLLSCFIRTPSLQLEVLAFAPSSGFCVVLLELPIYIYIYIYIYISVSSGLQKARAFSGRNL